MAKWDFLATPASAQRPLCSLRTLGCDAARCCMQAGQAGVNRSIIDLPCCGKRASESGPEGGRVVVVVVVVVSCSPNDPNLCLCVCAPSVCVPDV